MTALRYNKDKPRLAYILQFPSVIKTIARIMEFGAAKYDEGNWKKGGKPDDEYLNSMLRHLVAWQKGEPYDKDSGCSHLGHAIWNLMALQELNYPDEIYSKVDFEKQMKYWQFKKGEANGVSKPSKS